MRNDTTLTVIAYHYVRDLATTRFPRIKGLSLDRFRRQVSDLVGQYEMATLGSTLAFLKGDYRSSRNLCLLTFDDGLKEHYTDVLPVLSEAGVQGCFFPATACLEGRVASAHKVHFLMAALEFDDFERAFLDELALVSPETPVAVPADAAARAYPWDRPEVGALKYLANFVLSESLRDRVVDALFASTLGDEREFSLELYASWDDLKEMQAAGMTVGGHSHRHRALSSLDGPEQEADLTCSFDLLRAHLQPQEAWPFAYPYGWYDQATIDVLRRIGFACAFTVQPGSNPPAADVFTLRRFDTNDVSSGLNGRGAPID